MPKGSSVTSVSQLKGKKIAVAQGSSADYHLLATLTQAGLTPHDVQLVYLQPAQGLAAFSSGSVAAWDVWPPFVEQAEVLKGAKNIADGHGIVTNEPREWEDGYRKRWQHDKVVRSTHGVNCTGSCSSRRRSATTG